MPLPDIRVPFDRRLPSPAGTSLERASPVVLPGLVGPLFVDELLVEARSDELGVPVALFAGASGNLAELPAPLGSFPELFSPPTLAGPFGTPLTPDVPAPAEPAFGEPAGLAVPEGPLAAPDLPADAAPADAPPADAPPDELPPLPPPPPPPPWAKAETEARIRNDAKAAVRHLLIGALQFQDQAARRDLVPIELKGAKSFPARSTCISGTQLIGRMAMTLRGSHRSNQQIDEAQRSAGCAPPMRSCAAASGD
jgi:hypothetical protein